MTTKYKIGDRIRRISSPGNAGMQIGDEAIVVQVGTAPYDGWPYTEYRQSSIAHNPRCVELILPSGFEIGKQYVFCGEKNYKAYPETIYTVEHRMSNGRWAYVNNKGTPGFLKDGDWSVYKEYIPPPPEEWRAVFYRENGKPEISADYSSTKEKCESVWGTTSRFMYAIRTDAGVLASSSKKEC